MHALEKELKPETAKYPSYTNRAMVQRGVKPGWLGAISTMTSTAVLQLRPQLPSSRRGESELKSATHTAVPAGLCGPGKLARNRNTNPGPGSHVSTGEIESVKHPGGGRTEAWRS